MKFKQERVHKRPFEHLAHWKIFLSNILHTGRSAFQTSCTQEDLFFKHPAHWKICFSNVLHNWQIVCVSCGSQLFFNNCFSSVLRHGTWQAVVSGHCSSSEDLDEHWTATASYRSANERRAADIAQLQCPLDIGLHLRQTQQRGNVIFHPPTSPDLNLLDLVCSQTLVGATI